MKYENLAADFVKYIQMLANDEETLMNFESYLSYHFKTWMTKYAGTPEGIVSEIKQFAEMYK